MPGFFFSPSFSYGIRFCLCFITTRPCIKILIELMLWYLVSKAETTCVLIKIYNSNKKKWFHEDRSNTSLVWIRSWGQHAFAHSCMLAHSAEGKNLLSNGEKITVQHEGRLKDELSRLLRWIRSGEVFEEEILDCRDLHIQRTQIKTSQCKLEYIAKAQH